MIWGNFLLYCDILSLFFWHFPLFENSDTNIHTEQHKTARLRNFVSFSFWLSILRVKKLCYLFFSARFDAFLTCWQSVRTDSDGFLFVAWKTRFLSISMEFTIFLNIKTILWEEMFAVKGTREIKLMRKFSFTTSKTWWVEGKCYLLPKWFLITNIVH